MTSELIDLANGLGKIAVDYGGLGGLVVALGTLGYSFYSKREDSNTTRMPIQAEIVKITQAQQSDFFDKQNERYDSWTEFQNQRIDELQKEIVDLREQINKLNTEILGRDRLLVEKDAEIERKNLKITNLENKIKYKNRLIKELESKLQS
ncbi:hypothetical protein [Vagococcus fluvialis]|uniref:hypothetical protein n=1 Tax=Vagococcus fluvialis TaxID=2738 RepID=UPI001D0B45D5|nr:hypothetical protein [Vagococcus fluvialis]UDM72720.1 hypothetical protein K5L00_15145 [Vagococcus fluvialis]UDM78442.1 hypothetical protein K5K98_14475 [Vagococcus fluvialis]UDM83995.1 hypothetical protein K5K96_14295 [Vagococcus fluvialis]